MTSTEGASALEVRSDGNGQMWIAIDSLVDLFSDMANTSADGPVKNSMVNLANTFRPMSTYAGMDATVRSDDSTPLVAHHCPRCGGTVITGRRIGGRQVTVDAEPSTEGSLFPLRIDRGVPTLAPWRPGLDGVVGVRLAALVALAAVWGTP